MDRQEIREQVRRKLEDVVISGVAPFYTDDDLNDAINEAYYYYWQWLWNAKDPNAMLEAFLDIVGGQAEVSLPSDFHEARLVEQVVADGTIPLWWNERFEQPNFTGGFSNSSTFPAFTVRWVRNQLVLEPTPADSVTGGIKLTYWFIPPRLTQDTDVPDVALKDFYHDLLVYRTVIISKVIEEGIGQGGAPLGQWGALMAEKEQKFKETIERPTIQRLYTKPWGMYSDGGYGGY